MEESSDLNLFGMTARETSYTLIQHLKAATLKDINMEIVQTHTISRQLSW